MAGFHFGVPFFAHLARAARRALALRSALVNFFAVALPPRAPRSTAEGFLRGVIAQREPIPNNLRVDAES